MPDAQSTGGGSGKSSFSEPPPVSVSVPSAAASRPQRQRKLKPSQLLVAQAYSTPNQPAFLNKTESYQVAHPTAKRTTAAVEGHRVLRNPRVQAVVVDELEALGWSKERLERELAWNVNQCKDKGKLNDHREAIMSLAKLRGDLVDKSEVKAVDDHHKDAIRRLVAESLEAPN